jgi:hypothetical protein
MWEIPIFRKDPVKRCDGDLKRRSEDDSFGSSQPKWKHTLNYTLNYPTFSEPAIFSVPSSWWPSSGDVAIGVVPAENTSEDKMAFFLLESGPTPSWDRPRVRIVSFVGLSNLSRVHDLRLCNNNFCQRWRSDDDIVITLMSTPTRTDGFESECVAITRSIFSGPTEDFDFCPVSGRLVIITEDCKLRVMDFVAPPTWPLRTFSVKVLSMPC